MTLARTTEEEISMATLHALHDQGGQSPWLDNLRRDALASGELERLVAAGIRGVTSNPTIFQRSVLSGSDYDDQLRSLLAGGRSIEDAYWDMAIADVTAALDLLHPLYEETAGADGFVSIEMAGTVAPTTWPPACGQPVGCTTGSPGRTCS
jgi:transaldolase